MVTDKKAIELNDDGSIKKLELKGHVEKIKIERLGFSSFTNKVIEWANLEIDYCGG